MVNFGLDTFFGLDTLSITYDTDIIVTIVYRHIFIFLQIEATMQLKINCTVAHILTMYFASVFKQLCSCKLIARVIFSIFDCNHTLAVTN